MRWQFVWVRCLWLLLACTPVQALSCDQPVVNAEFDLGCISDNRPILNLQGQWKLHYQAEDGDFQFSDLTAVPGIWRKLPGNEQQYFRGNGVYEMTLTGAAPARPLSLLLPLSWSTRTVYLQHPDGERQLVFSAQPVTPTANATSTPVANAPIPLPSLQAGMRLQIMMTAIDSRYSGLWRAPKLGFSRELTLQQTRSKLFHVAQSSMLLVLTLLVLYMWYQYRGNFSLLLLSLASLAMILRQLANADILTDIWPSLSIGTQVLISWGTYLFGTSALIAFFYQRFPEHIRLYQVVIPVVSNVIGFAILLFAGISAIQAYAMIARPIVILSLLFIFFQLMVKSDWRSSDIAITMGGFFLLITGLVIEIVFYQLTGDEIPFPINDITLTLFLVSQAYLLSRHFLSAVRKNLQLRSELAGINASLETKIAERTRELSEQNRVLEQQSTTDELTGIANRWQINQFAKQVLRESEISGIRLSLILIDLDFFKQVNDQYGHNVGDQVLKDFAQLLSTLVRDVDLAGRWGGEEFCVLAPDLPEGAVMLVAERIRQRVSEYRFDLPEGQFSVTVSLGVVVQTQNSTFRQLMQKADTALYRAKRLGRNRVCVFDPQDSAY